MAEIHDKQAAVVPEALTAQNIKPQGPGIILTNKSASRETYNFYNNIQNGNGWASPEFNKVTTSATLNAGDSQFVSLDTNFKGRVQRGSQHQTRTRFCGMTACCFPSNCAASYTHQHLPTCGWRRRRQGGSSPICCMGDVGEDPQEVEKAGVEKLSTRAEFTSISILYVKVVCRVRH